LAGYFFDTSALVKLYHQEVGTEIVEAIVQTEGARVFISRLSRAETISAFAIKVRTVALDRQDVHFLLRQFRKDISKGVLDVRSIGEPEFADTEQLIERYGFDLRLRALDGLQLAVARALRNQRFVDYFVASDKILCKVAALEGFAVINPERA
jgi:predicted nucleic acid-binding protein